ncbi:hypothetical protein LCGC14_0677210 [marine sediment metagenome]|uniref:Uncharacterized protein n=1 Tax=marine sediment metagenome TaxID=412755 RepID=A0A0F9R9G9_9ZZZZ
MGLMPKCRYCGCKLYTASGVRLCMAHGGGNV